jgi:hypothetical protein
MKTTKTMENEGITTSQRMQKKPLVDEFIKQTAGIMYPQSEVPRGLTVYDLGNGYTRNLLSLLRLSNDHECDEYYEFKSQTTTDEKTSHIMKQGFKSERFGGSILFCAWQEMAPNYVIMWERNRGNISYNLIGERFDADNKSYAIKDEEISNSIPEVNPQWLHTCFEVRLSYFAYSTKNTEFVVFVCISNSLSSLLYPKYLSNGTPILWILPPSSDGFADMVTRTCEDSNILVAIDAITDILTNHSNIVSIYPKLCGEKWCIAVGVVGKGFIPCGEMPLPSHWHGYNISITNGFIYFATSNTPFGTLQTVQPGCAISPQCLAPLSTSCTFGTLGGFVYHKNKTFAVTCGHLFVQNEITGKMCELDSEVMQSSGLAHLLGKMKFEYLISDPFAVWNNLIESRFGDKSGRIDAALKEIDFEGSAHDFNEQNANNVIGKLKRVQFAKITPSFENTRDVAIFELNSETIYSSLVFNQGCSKKQKIQYDVDLSINLESNNSCWTTEQVKNVLLNGININLYGYGVRSGPFQGKLCSMNYIFYYPHKRNIGEPAKYKFVNCIVTTMRFDEGDSGAWVWSIDKDVKLIMGMVSFTYIDNNVRYGIIIPIWEILKAFEDLDA